MLSYIVRRILQSFVVLLMVLVLTFSLPYFQPNGIYAQAYVAQGTHINQAQILAYGAQYGLNHPYFVRLWNYFFQVVFHFNLGYSQKNNLPVTSIISIYVPRTVWLALSALLLTLLISVPLGMYQAAKRNSVFDYAATGTAFVLYAMPSFLLALLVVQFFSFGILHLPSSPPSGVAPWAIFTDPKGFILPVACLTMLGVAGVSRFMRGSVLEVMVQDYIRTARAKGCSSRRVLFKHTFRNALGPIIIILGLSLPALFGGALIIEDVFNYQGLGVETVNAAINLDTDTVLGITLLVAIFTLLGNLLADIVLGLVNPRIRVERSGR